jgi:hypothetical protein
MRRRRTRKRERAGLGKELRKEWVGMLGWGGDGNPGSWGLLPTSRIWEGREAVTILTLELVILESYDTMGGRRKA